MEKKLRAGQEEVLRAFGRHAKNFALAGGTALELYYLHHRFSADLDFFSPKYNLKEIETLILEFKKSIGNNIRFKAEFAAANRARVRFYEAKIKRYDRPLKLDFIEDTLFEKPAINTFEGVRVYSVKDIYLQKIIAVTGGSLSEDETGREVAQGRRQARDAFDIYALSRKILPLNEFLIDKPAVLQRGIVHWYQTFSRQDLKFDLLDLDIYDKGFNSREMISYLESQIQKLIKRLLR